MNVIRWILYSESSKKRLQTKEKYVSSSSQRVTMNKIFTTKISLQASNPTFSYPIVRLPRELKELAGRIVNIYQIEINGVEGFFIALQLDKLDKLDKFVENNIQTDSRLKAPQSPLFPQNPQKLDGLGRIRTGDLRQSRLVFWLRLPSRSLQAHIITS